MLVTLGMDSLNYRRFAAALVMMTAILTASTQNALAQSPEFVARLGNGADPVGELVDALIPASPPPGRKDLVGTLQPFKIGYALWDGGAVPDLGHAYGEHGSYMASIAELHHEYDAVPSFTCPSQACFENGACIAPCTGAGGMTTPVAAIDTSVYPALFQVPWTEFSLAGAGSDFGLAFTADSAADINYYSLQETVFSPRNERPAGLMDGLENLIGHGFETFVDVLVPMTDALRDPPASREFWITPNIGFANNFLFNAGHAELGARYPMITKYGLPGSPPAELEACELPSNYASHIPPAVFPPGKTPLRAPQTWSQSWGLLDPMPNVPETYLHLPMNMVHPEVAALMLQNIQELVTPTTPYPEGLVAYFLVMGEHFIDSYRNRPDNWHPAQPFLDCSATFTADSYFHCLSGTDYSDHSYRQFREWLKRKYGTLDALSTAWTAASGWPAVASCDSQDWTDCIALDPLLTAVGGAATTEVALREVFEDWEEFQRHQRDESEDAQYRAAKAVAPQERHYTLQIDIDGVDRGALYSDGVALGNWYVDNSSRHDILTQMKKRALHAVAYGESLNFPIFGMPRMGGQFTGCWNTATFDPSIPATFHPPCWDYAFANRTLREFLALGVDSLGIAYWENFTDWSLQDGTFTSLSIQAPSSDFAGSDLTATQVNAILADGDIVVGPDGSLQPGIVAELGSGPIAGTVKNGTFTQSSSLHGPTKADGGEPNVSNMAEKMSREAAAWRTRRAFMTPWKSPLLVHVGDSVVKRFGGASTATPYREALVSGDLNGMTNHVLDQLGTEQIQYAPFAKLAGLDDLWLVSQREILLSPFVPELDQPHAGVSDTLMQVYLDATDDHGWNALILTDRPTLDALEPQLEADPGLAGPAIVEPGLRALSLASAPGATRLIVGFDVVPFDLDLGPGVVHGVRLSTQALAQLNGLVTNPLLGLDALSSTSLRPVRAVLQGTDALAPDVDVCVSTDGLNFFVSAAYTGNQPGQALPVELKIDEALATALTPSWTFEGGSLVFGKEILGAGTAGGGLVGGGPGSALGLGLDHPQLTTPDVVGTAYLETLVSVIRYARADVDFNGIDLAALITAVTAVQLSLDQLEADGYGVDAGRLIADMLVDLVETDDSSDPGLREKVIAGLMRLERMVFVRYINSHTSSILTDDGVHVVDIDGEDVEGAYVQLEFPLQGHARRYGLGELVTTESGTAFFDATPPTDAACWDFISEQYVLPQPGDAHVVEVHVQHAVHGGQTVFTRAFAL